MSKITQGDIAEKLNLSVATVSRALRGDEAIHPDVRAQVVQMASKVGYRQRGKSTIENNGNTTHYFIGVFVKIHTDVDAWAPDEIVHGYLAGLSEVSPDLNVSLLVHHVNDETIEDLIDPEKQPPMLRDKSLHGVILIHYFPPHIVDKISEICPVVSIVHDLPTSGNDTIDMDHYHGYDVLVNKLYEAGHRKIGFLGYRPHLAWGRARLAAYLQPIFQLGLKIDPAIILGELDIEVIKKKIAGGVTAWVCSIDSIAYRLYRDLLDEGYKVPEEVSLVGFNGIKPLLNCPQIDTIRAPLKDMGAAALRRMLSRLQMPLGQTKRILLRCEVVEGNTIGEVKVD